MAGAPFLNMSSNFHIFFFLFQGRLNKGGVVVLGLKLSLTAISFSTELDEFSCLVHFNKQHCKDTAETNQVNKSISKV